MGNIKEKIIYWAVLPLLKF